MNSKLFDLLESTSLPGLPLLFKIKQLIVKIFWLLSLILLMGLSIRYVTESIQSYFDYEVITNIKVIRELTPQFPAISFCVNFTQRSNSTISDLKEFIINCTFEQNPFNSTDFEIYKDPFQSTCFRFNSGKNAYNQTTPIKISKQKGIRLSGLDVSFNTSKLGIIDMYGAIITAFVNNASDLFLPIRPYYIHQDNLQIQIKGVNSIKIDRDFIQNLPEPHNQCVTKEKTANFSHFFFHFIQKNITYLQDDCIDLCIFERIEEACNCTKSFGKYSECFRTSFECIQSKASSYQKKIEIPLECYSYCPKECESINIKTSQTYLGPVYGSDESSSFKQDLVRVYAYYPRLEYTLINQIAKMNSFDLVSSVGGTLGLFIGFSFFTLVEIIEIISELIGYYLNKKEIPTQTTK